MAMNKQKGNMYGFVTHTWNAIKGRCSHDCSYCYMRPFWKSDVYLDEKELKTDLGEGNVIFVGSSTDMWAKDVPTEWIIKVLKHCSKYPKNKYLFQTKNPERFKEGGETGDIWREFVFNLDVILGTTIETNRETKLSKAPSPFERLKFMRELETDFSTMITIEPILNFDLDNLAGLIYEAEPTFVNIGGDSKGHSLKEPTKQKIEQLIERLETFTKVNLKDNLKRLYTSS